MKKCRDTIYYSSDPLDSWLAPVGRLDESQEGLYLPTIPHAAKIADRNHSKKTYPVQIATSPRKLTRAG